LNVRDAQYREITQNAELGNVVQILGLNYRKKYGKREGRDLRYGRILLMCDQDQDGSHIKALFINFIHRFWPELLIAGDFLYQFLTPLVKAHHTGKGDVQSFYTIAGYKEWREKMGKRELRRWKIKYYKVREGVLFLIPNSFFKGLGTNTAQEGREYFKNLDNHVVRFIWTEDSASVIRKAFSKDKGE